MHSLKITIKCQAILNNTKIGDSIAVNGTCLTATEIGNNYFTADCMYETVERTNLKRLKTKELVNLEKSVTLATPLGGHLVTGDVDCEGIITNIQTKGIAKIYEIKINKKYMKYIVEKGRITLDGASLTVTNFSDNTFSVALIPHTQQKITLGKKKIGSYINIETDLIGKYIERFLTSEIVANKNNTKEISVDFLLKNGF